ncbi:MAG TPA: hypothetical protein VFR84_15885 [Candidatus Angelobacter sp.]|nr:hypothetical protein [Candidatus Angelobacter sp.]
MQLVFFVIALLILQPRAGSSPSSTHDTTDDSVGFQVRLERGPARFNETTSWSATYTSNGHTAKFLIELNAKSKSSAGPIPISFGKGRFLAQPGSDSTTLIAALKKALQAKKVPAKPKRVAEVPFEYAILGRGQHRAPDGSFNSQQPGDWITLKLFFGDDEGEVFLNLNPVTGKGEFSIKDADYGDYVVGKLAQVL